MQLSLNNSTGLDTTEDGHLQGYTSHSIANGDMSAWYNYNADGERNFKITTPNLNMRQNALSIQGAATLIYPTLYASALITINKGGYTAIAEVERRASSLAMPRCSNVTESKFYFEGTNRMCSKIGGGFSNINLNSIAERVPALAEDYDQQYVRQYESVEHTFNECLSIEIDMGSTIDLYEVIVHETERDDPEPAFFYHSDHLGSAAYLTNDAGQVTQTLNYLPYGEDWVDIQNYADTRYPRLGIYSYNGKGPRQGWRTPLNNNIYSEQRDYESGFHYYGARYYWSELLTAWLSVDPMMDKYPNISPYAYCAWNPIILNDPDGNFPVYIHKKLIDGVLNNKAISSNIRKGLLFGTGICSDWLHPNNSSFHMANMKGTKSIIKLYQDHRKNFSDNMDLKKYVDAGANLHAIADFYSHSNYVDLYQQYYESHGETVSAEDIKPFSEMMENQDFMNYVEGQGGLKTGTFSIKSWAAEKIFKKAPEQGSHSLMNLDENDPKKSPHGTENFGTSGTRHQAASVAAQKEFNKLIKEKLP